MRDWPPSQHGRRRRRRNTTIPSRRWTSPKQHGKTVLTATLTGDFPGSPVTVHFDFVLEAGKILSLEIHA